VNGTPAQVNGTPAQVNDTSAQVNAIGLPPTGADPLRVARQAFAQCKPKQYLLSAEANCNPEVPPLFDSFSHSIIGFKRRRQRHYLIQ
jgi:hypothetical protein